MVDVAFGKAAAEVEASGFAAFPVIIRPMPINVVALVKGDEQYAFIYDDNSLPQLLQALGRYAADPELSFEWKDAARLSCAATGKEWKRTEPKPKRCVMQTLTTTIIWGAMGGLVTVSAYCGSAVAAAVCFLLGSVAMAMRLEDVFLDAKYSRND